jgi:hypothetical protein
MINYNQSLPQEEISSSSPMLPSVDQAQKLKDMGMLNDETFGKVMQKIDPNFLKSVIQVESAGKADAVSPKGAQGLMQVMPATAKEVAGQLGMMNYDINKPEDNIAIGSKYLSDQIDKYGNKELALAAYNAGPGAVDRAIQKAGSNDPQAVLANLPKETQNYVPKVMAGYQGQAPSESQYAAPNMQASSIDDIGESINTSLARQQDGLNISAQAGIQKAQEEASFMRERAAQQEQILIEQQQKEAQRQEQIKQQELKAQQTLDEFSNTKIDPNRYWSQKGTGEKIVAGIAIALGALGQGLTKSNNNQALDIITGQIDRDIEAQKMEILGKRETAQGQRSLLQEMRARFDDERVAEQMTRVLSLDQARTKLDEIASKSKSEEVKANQQLLSGQLEEKRTQAMIQLNKAIAESPEGQMRMQQVQSQKMEALAKGTINPESLTEKERERYVEGLGVANTAKEAEDLKTSLEEFKSFDTLMGKIIEERKSTGGEAFNTTAARQQKARAAQAILAIKNMEKLGALDRGALEVAGAIIPEDPTELRPFSSMRAQLTDVRERAREMFAQKLQTRLAIKSPEAEKTIADLMSTTTFQEDK